ncbi:GNAT family N-acetyltransferase [Tumebacillus sp. ITR2]|uniref:GNAT family N-acetyltransferase n=1 Tax=Tumebacillus amylolyticus TaxID=2801339 RepID=A0ABS1J9U7_9BACL|nr:GNAT family N-acetyltransferase [Tumebacillus amylolyticus]MBL0387000.1 GNAT family N-acetyltransferase [Tumebacillus amylolyticus]
MDYTRITSIEDPLFKQLHNLMKEVFPPEEVLAYEDWAEPLQDPGIRVFVAVEDGEVVGITEYRYYEDMQVAMTDFTIVGREGRGIGPFLAKKRQEDLFAVVQAAGRELIGMFAEIYNPYLVKDYEFGGLMVMNPFVRREVLSHLGYRKLDLDYVHPSWQQDGEAVHGLDLCFLTYREGMNELPAELVSRFLKTYYTALPDKPQEWYSMVEKLEQRDTVQLLPI